jgi:hypothetical protein
VLTCLAMLLLQYSCVITELFLLCAGSASHWAAVLCLILLHCARVCLSLCPCASPAYTLSRRGCVCFLSSSPLLLVLLLQRGHCTCGPQGSKRNAHKRWRQRGWRMGRCVRRTADDSKGGGLWPSAATGPIRYARDAVCSGTWCTPAGLIVHACSGAA